MNPRDKIVEARRTGREDFYPVGGYFKKSLVTMALNQTTKEKRKERVMLLYAANIIDSAETLKLLQKSEELQNA